PVVPIRLRRRAAASSALGSRCGGPLASRDERPRRRRDDEAKDSGRLLLPAHENLPLAETRPPSCRGSVITDKSLLPGHAPVAYANPNRSILSRISSAVFVHLTGWPLSLCVAT